MRGLVRWHSDRGQRPTPLRLVQLRGLSLNTYPATRPRGRSPVLDGSGPDSASGSLTCGGLLARTAPEPRRRHARSSGSWLPALQEISVTPSTSVATGAIGSVTSTHVRNPVEVAEDGAAILRPAHDGERHVEGESLPPRSRRRASAVASAAAREGDERTVGGPVWLEVVRPPAGDKHVLAGRQVHEMDVSLSPSTWTSDGRSVGEMEMFAKSRSRRRRSGRRLLEVLAIGVHPIEAVVEVTVRRAGEDDALPSGVHTGALASSAGSPMACGGSLASAAALQIRSRRRHPIARMTAPPSSVSIPLAQYKILEPSGLPGV